MVERMTSLIEPMIIIVLGAVGSPGFWWAVVLAGIQARSRHRRM